MAMPYYVTPLLGALAWALIASPNSGFDPDELLARLVDLDVKRQGQRARLAHQQA